MTLEALGKSHGFMLAVMSLFTTATVLLILKFISESTWVSFSEWIWSAQVLGGLGKVTADRWASSRSGSNGSPQASHS